MKIAVVGLGLIGGSFCKAISMFTDNKCFGIDRDDNVIKKALSDKVIERSITSDELADMDLTITALHPRAAVSFMLDSRDKFKKNSIVIDVCGVKEKITDSVYKPLSDNGICYIGAHPMAGREFSGYDYSRGDLFQNASMVLTPTDINNNKNEIKSLDMLCRKLGFREVVITTPEEHDRIIAFTSQLAHIVSSSYIKSPYAQKQRGFSAGSYLDMTRVAKLNEDMWSELFLMNKNALVNEIDEMISHLGEYRSALFNEDYDELHDLLKRGRILKEKEMK